MIDFNEPVLSDKQRADAIFHATDYRANDYCFGNLFIWRKKSGVKIAFHEGFVLVRFERDGNLMYLYPAGSGDKADIIRELAQDAQQLGKPFRMACVTPAMRIELESLFPEKFNFITDRNNYDYVYHTQDLINLSGKKYHSKRNHITRFNASGEWSYEEISASNITECVEMNDKWCKENGCGQDKGLREEYCAVREALKNYDTLGFEGGLLRLYGKVVAFTLGERLCVDTFDVHIEKAFSTVEGAYPTINNEFVMHSCSTYLYVNREEDTGDEGLRKAKLSYQPAILLEKDIAALRTGEAL
jgi:hypothetical protein